MADWECLTPFFFKMPACSNPLPWPHFFGHPGQDVDHDESDPAPSTAMLNKKKLANCLECEEVLKSLSRRVSSRLEEAVF